jgi:hypothetical protein
MSKVYEINTGMINAMGNVEMSKGGERVATKEDLLKVMKEFDFSYTTEPEKAKENMIKAFDESFASGEDSMTYDSGYWTTYDSEICDYESDSERNKVLIAVDIKEED